MKRTLTLLVIMVTVLVANAQIATKTGDVFNGQAANKPSVVLQNDKAPGDTLMYCDGYYFFVNPTDMPTFDINIEDIDGNTPYNSGYFTAFGTFYDIDPSNWWMPWDVDTAFYFAATSWFNPAGQADNWLEFGPITVPAGGATLSWYWRTNPAYRDGYEVLVSTTGMTNYTDFTDPAIYTLTDAYPSPTYGTDTLWNDESVTLDAGLNGQQVYFAFHHNANDMDVLYIDEILVVEGSGSGLAEAGQNISIFQNSPNPADQQTVISYQIANSGNVAIQVLDVTGRVVINNELGNQVAGIHNYTLNTSDLSSGVYFYVLNVDNNRAVNKMIVDR